MRNPLVIAYQSIKGAIRKVHGETFVVRDGSPDSSEFSLIDNTTKKPNLPAANISYVSSTTDKALMREHEPHGLIDNNDGTFTIGTEAIRFDYLIQVSFYAERPGTALRLATEFVAYIEKDNEIPISNDKWESSMNIFTTHPPIPPRGERGLYQSDLTFSCQGKLIVEEVVNSIDVSKFKLKII